MPFDGVIEDPRIAIYRKRRQDAIKIWREIPSKNFDIRFYKNHHPREYFTICCAIGWLAEKKHDGWDFKSRTPFVPWPVNKMFDHQRGIFSRIFKRSYPCHSVAWYFGLTTDQARQLFTVPSMIIDFYQPKLLSMISTDDVIEALGSMPYTIHKNTKEVMKKSSVSLPL